jgi:hypothetical protein
MSGVEYEGYNFSKLYKQSQLDQIPKEYETAAMAHILCNPRPDVLNLRLSPAIDMASDTPPLVLFEDFKPALGTTWLAAYSNSCKTTTPEYDRFQTIDLHLGGREFKFFDNYGGTKSASCATRVLQLLGLVSTISDKNDLITNKVSGRLLDPAKFGVLSEQILSAFITAYHPQFFVFADASATDVSFSDVEMLLDSLATAFPQASVLAVLIPGHVQYAVKTSLLESELDIFNRIEYAHSQQEPIFNSTVMRKVIDNYPPNKGRAGGRIHISLEDIARTTLPSGSKAILEAFARHATNNNFEAVFVTTLALLPFLESRLTRDLIAMFVRNADDWFTLDFPQLVKKLKKVNQFVRIYQRLPGLGLPAYTLSELRELSDDVCGIDILPGRSELLTLDFNAELLMRTADPTIRAVPTVSNYGLSFSSELYEKYEDLAIQDTFNDLLPSDVPLETFDSWYDRRMFWAASGGSPGSKVTWSKEGVEEAARLNKRGALLAIPAKHFHAILEDALKPVQWSVKALKYEPGKLRSILNTAMEHYIFQAYLLDHFDAAVKGGTWYSSSNAGLNKLVAHLDRIDILKTEVGLMWDFADFNINHTFSGMIKLFDELRRRLTNSKSWSSHGQHDLAIRDINIISKWVMRARENTFISDNDSGNLSQVVRSLQSGERATSWVNTLRNNVDHGIVSRAAIQLFGKNTVPRPGHKTGDDVFLSTQSMDEALLTCALYNLCGCAGQVSKIFVSYHQDGGARGEFVRYGYDAQKNSVRGYPLRALTGLVHGEYFNEPIVSPADKSATLIEQISKLERRGIKLPPHLQRFLFDKNCYLVYTKDDGSKRRVVIPRELVTLPAALGGVGVTQSQKNDFVVARDSRPNLTVNRKFAICIPSGEGKTMLVKRYPTLFVDHDDFLDDQAHELRDKALQSGQWREFNAYLRRCARNHDKVLLTWSTQTIPEGTELAAIALLTKSTGIRANVQNRKDLNREVTGHPSLLKRTIRASSYKDRDYKLVALAVKLLAPSSPIRYKYVDKKTKEIMQVPRFQFPNLPASDVLRKAKTHVSDYAALERFGALGKVARLDQSLLASALTGAIPKRLLSDSLALQARTLDKYLLDGELVPFSAPALQDFSPLAVFSEIKTTLRDILLKHRSSPSVLVRTPSHNYNSLTALIRPLGFSDGAGLQLAIKSQKPTRYHGDLGRLWTLFGLAGKTASFAPMSQVTKVDDMAQTIRYYASLLPSDPSNHQLIYDYFSGGLNLYPPTANHLSSEVVSVIRDFGLQYFEGRHWSSMARGPLYVREVLAAIDTVAQNAIVSVLDEFCPGFHIRD